MFKKIIALFLALNLLSFSVCFASDNWGDNTNVGEDNIVDKITWLESDVYSISGNCVFGVTAGTNLNEFKSNFKNAGTSLENIIIDTDRIKTGDTVRFNGSSDVYYVVVDGDVIMDGVVNSTDLVMINQLVSAPYSDSLEYKAANIDKQGTVTVVDVVIARSIILQ